MSELLFFFTKCLHEDVFFKYIVLNQTAKKLGKTVKMRLVSQPKF